MNIFEKKIMMPLGF